MRKRKRRAAARDRYLFKVGAQTSGKIKFITLAAELGHLNLFALNIGNT